MFPRKYLPQLLMISPFISGFSDHWLHAKSPCKEWPLQPKVAFSVNLIAPRSSVPQASCYPFT